MRILLRLCYLYFYKLFVYDISIRARFAQSISSNNTMGDFWGLSMTADLPGITCCSWKCEHAQNDVTNANLPGISLLPPSVQTSPIARSARRRQALHSYLSAVKYEVNVQ